MNRYPPSQDAQNLLKQLAKLSEGDFSALQNAYYYRWLQLVLRSLGWLNLILGGFTLWLGLSGIDLGIFRIIQAFLGALMIGVSLWGLAIPSRQVLFGYIIVFILSGTWNLFLAIAAGAFSNGILLTVWGMLQLRWAYQYYRKYYPHFPLNIAKPSDETRALYDAIWKEFAETRYVNNEHLLEVNFWTQRWRGFIFEGRLALANPKSKLVIFARKSEIDFDAKNPEGAGKNLSGVFMFRNLKNKATMQRDFFERYLRWKAAT